MLKVWPLVAWASKSATGLSMTTAMGTSLHWVLWAPRLDQCVEVQGIGEIQELVAQPADLHAGRQGHGERCVEHGAAGLWRLVGITGQVFQLDVMVDEELAQLVDDVRAVGRADVRYIRQGLWAVFQRRTAHHVDREVVLLRQARQAGFQTR